MSRNLENANKNVNVADFSELLNWLIPLKLTQSADLEATMVRGFVDENDQLWLETDELGIFTADFFMALVMAENLRGDCDEHQ